MGLAHRRQEAKALRAAVLAGEADAIERVLASHPKLAGRPAGLGGVRFGLRDAQATLARELGMETWAELCRSARAEEDQPSPEHGVSSGATFGPAFDEARRQGARAATSHHVLRALLRRPSAAQRALLAAGAEAADPDAAPPSGTTSSTPALHSIEAFACALALAEGRDRPADEHLLIALVYEHRTGSSALLNADLDPDELYDLLAEQGVHLPPVRPPAPPLPDGPLGPFVYVPQPRANNVISVLRAQHPPGTLHWMINVSQWKPGWVYFIAEEAIDLASLVSTALAPTGDEPELVALDEAMRNEEHARNQRARDSGD
ncbi:MAG: Clp protease N-terminal domain-containing protein [Acidimicrobiia bacterium]